MKINRFFCFSKGISSGPMKLVLCFAFLISLSSFQVIKEMSEPTIKALFVYNFTKYIEWEGEKDLSHFVIGIYGPSDVTKELKRICSNKKIKNKNIEIQEITENVEAEYCDILFIPKSQSSQLRKFVEQLAGKQVLIVTEEKGMAAMGACINIIQKDDKFRFELNETAVHDAGLKISNQLLSLSIIIQE